MVLKQVCQLPDDPDDQLHPVDFIYCRNPECDALEERRKKARADSSVKMPTSEEVKEAGCYNCLDVPNAANLGHNIGVLKDWKDDAKRRCNPPSNPP